jgi:signal transduction histidine kinase/ActR/RegA family two-component response regulator
MTRREEILGRGIFEVFPDNPADLGATGVSNLRASLDRVLHHQVPDTMAVQKYDIRRPPEEGGGFEERWWSPVNSPVLGQGGDLAYIIHRVEDVTGFIRLEQAGAEQQRLASELRERAGKMQAEIVLRGQELQGVNQRLRRANEEITRLYEKTRELDDLKSQFFANVSHELRTPLALILGPTEQLLALPETAGIARHDLEIIARNARTLLHQVDDLLDVAKLEAGRMQPEYFETDVARLVRFVAGHFDVLARERHLAYSIDAPDELLMQVDPRKLQRVLQCLLSNAFKFTPAGGAIRVTLRRAPASDRMLLEVADSGPGIPPDKREAVFERFRQLEGGPARRFGGTGLGLSIARELILLLGGRISISEAPEGGALLAVELPASAPPGAAVYPGRDLEAGAPIDVRQAVGKWSARSQGAGLVSGPREGALVLVVEDHSEMNDFILENLEERYRVAAAFDGREGLEKARSLRPDLILCDIMMPELSGDELIHAIREIPALDTTPIIILSAKADDSLRVKLLREGAQDYLTKPFSIEELRARVGNLVARKRADEL